MLTITGQVSGSWVSVQLPDVSGWSLVPPRLSASRTALDAHVIHQPQLKQVSAAAPSYASMVDQEKAELVRRMDSEGTQVYISDGNRVYLAIIDARPETPNGKRAMLRIAFKIVSLVVGVL